MYYTPGIDMSVNDVSDSVHFFILLDTSASMSGLPIQQLNDGMFDLLNEICYYAEKKEVNPLMHILSFGSEIRWQYGSTATHGISASQIAWHDLPTVSGTNTAAAIEAILEGLSLQHLGYHSYPPIIVLISDGRSDDPPGTLTAIRKLENHPYHTIRVAVGPKGCNTEELEAFASTGTVCFEDGLGNLSSTRRTKLLFPMERTSDLAELISTLAITS